LSFDATYVVRPFAKIRKGRTAFIDTVSRFKFLVLTRAPLASQVEIRADCSWNAGPGCAISGGAPTRRNPRVCGHASADAELPGMGETKGLMKAAPKRPAASRLRYRSAGYQIVGLHSAAVIGPRHRHHVPARPARPPEAGRRAVVGLAARSL
jgi:hypothetical protein